MFIKIDPQILLFLFSLIFIVTSSILYILNESATETLLTETNKNYDWIIRGCLNILSYLTIILPGYIVFKYIRRINYLDKTGE